MGNISSNIAITSTLREFIAKYKENSTISSSSNDPNAPSIPEEATNINVIWDGDSYYITYDVVVNENNIITTTTTIDDIGKYLPLTITTSTPDESES